MSLPSVLLAGFDPRLLDTLLPELKDMARVHVSRSQHEALETLEAHDVAVLCLGPGISGPSARDLVDASLTPRRTDGPRASCRNIVLSGGSDPEIYQSLVGGKQLFYLSYRLPAAEDIAGILRGALEHPLRLAQTRSDAQRVREVCDLARFLASETDPRRLSLGVAQATKDLTGADRARCLYYDVLSESFTAWVPKGSAPWVGNAVSGIVSFVARTGLTVRSDKVGDDPRYAPDVDNPRGDWGERLLAVPVKFPLLEAEAALKNLEAIPAVLAVLVVTRSADTDPFEDLDVKLLELLADRLAPAFERLVSPVDESSRQDNDSRSGRESLFTAEALRQYNRDGEELGLPLEISPRWMRWVFPLMVTAFIIGLLYTFVGTIDEYAQGVAVVRVEGATSSVVAVFPGRFRPQLEPGMPLHLIIHGYDTVTQRLTIESVGEIVAASEAGRTLGAGIPDGVPHTGSVVMVRCMLFSGRFASGSKTYEYYDGLQGAAEVRVGSERLLFSLLPGLRAVSEDGHG